MNHDITTNTILDKVYELEGLLKLRQDRSDLPPQFNGIIIDKIKCILEFAEKELRVAPEAAREATREAAPEPEVNRVSQTIQEAEYSSEPEIVPASEDIPDKKVTAEKVIYDTTFNLQSGSLPEESGAIESEFSNELNPPDNIITSVEKNRIRFPINDRIRFCRELFSGDMKNFDATISFVESIPGWTDVEDYFYSDLGWDPANKEVGEFICMLRHLFLRKK